MTFDWVGMDVQQDGLLEAQALSRRVQLAEEHGFDSAWITGSIRPGSPGALETLSYAAGVTSRIGLGVGVLLPALFSPVHLARSVATLDHLSAGRFVLGVGLGPGGDSYAKHGVATPAHRGEHLEQRLLTLLSLLRDERTSATDPALADEPRPLAPFRAGGPPVWFGVHSDAALDRACRLGSGWLAGAALPLGRLRDRVAMVETLRAKHGIDPADFAIGKRVVIHVGRMDTTARTELEQRFGGYNVSAETMSDLVLSGEPDELVDRLAAMREMGVKLLVLSPLVDAETQMAQLAAEVCPKLPMPDL